MDRHQCRWRKGHKYRNLLLTKHPYVAKLLQSIVFLLVLLSLFFLSLILVLCFYTFFVQPDRQACTSEKPNIISGVLTNIKIYKKYMERFFCIIFRCTQGTCLILYTNVFMTPVYLKILINKKKKIIRKLQSYIFIAQYQFTFIHPTTLVTISLLTTNHTDHNLHSYLKGTKTYQFFVYFLFVCSFDLSLLLFVGTWG